MNSMTHAFDKANTEEKTPWNPSRTATARVRNPLPAPKNCNCCGNACVEIFNNSTIYGREYGDWPWVYQCMDCEAYVGLHPYTAIPLGTLANAPMREARKKAKAAFNPIWKNGEMKRTAAYVWLAERLGIANAEECHIGWFDVDTCNRVVAICRDYVGEQVDVPEGDDLTIGLRVRVDCYGGPFFGTVIGRDVSGGVERIIYRREGDGKKIRHFAGQVKAAAIGKAMP